MPLKTSKMHMHVFNVSLAGVQFTHQNMINEVFDSISWGKKTKLKKWPALIFQICVFMYVRTSLHLYLDLSNL